MKKANARIALVTGANRGLGLETSRQLLGRGLRVAMTGRDLGATQRALEELGAGSDAIAVEMDVADAASIAAARRTIADRLGAVEVLVNNAAVLFHENDDVLPSRPTAIGGRSKPTCSAPSMCVASSLDPWPTAAMDAW